MSIPIHDLRKRPIKYVDELILSSAQNFEDVLLYRAFEGKRIGFYVDIGAGDPNWDSVTAWFYRVGWRGINIEPNPLFRSSYARYRTQDVTLEIAIARTRGTSALTCVEPNAMGHGWGLSSLDVAAADRADSFGFATRKVVVETMPLADVLAKHAHDVEIDFLKVDVEGFEAEVLASSDWERFRPTVVCVEAVNPMSATPSFDAWEHILLQAHYDYALFDGVNSYYVRQGSVDVLTQFNAGVNVNDRFRRITVEDVVAPPLDGANSL